MAGVRKVLAAAAATAPVLAGTGAAPALAAPSAPGETAVPEAGGVYYTWQNRGDGLYLHVVGASKANSAAVNVAAKSGTCAEHGSTNTQCAEVWSRVSTGYAHEFAYKNINSGKCLDDPEDEPNVGAVQYSCGTYQVQRRWIYAGYISVNNGHNDEIYNAAGTLAGDAGHWLCVSGTNVHVGYNGGAPSIACGWQ
jgi:hypothetical protein